MRMMPRNALMSPRHYDDDPREMPPEGMVEGESGPPDQYIPLDEPQRNRLAPRPVQYQGAQDPRREEAMLFRQQLRTIHGMRPSPDTQRQLRALADAVKANPFAQTDDILEGLDMVGERHGVNLFGGNQGR